jgi:hypothetical protein
LNDGRVSIVSAFALMQEVAELLLIAQLFTRVTAVDEAFFGRESSTMKARDSVWRRYLAALAASPLKFSMMRQSLLPASGVGQQSQCFSHLERAAVIRLEKVRL